VIQPGWLNDLRVSRFLLARKAMSEIPRTFPYTGRLYIPLRGVERPAGQGAGERFTNRFSSGLPLRPNATIRSPVAAAMSHGRPAANTAIKRITP
jgi:hypothetical protein